MPCIIFNLILMSCFSFLLSFVVFFSCLSLHPSSSRLVCKTWWQSIKKDRTEREEPELLFVFLSFFVPLEMMQNSTVFEHLVKERENQEFFSGFAFSPVSPSLLAVEKSWYLKEKFPQQKKKKKKNRKDIWNVPGILGQFCCLGILLWFLW